MNLLKQFFGLFKKNNDTSCDCSLKKEQCVNDCLTELTSDSFPPKRDKKAAQPLLDRLNNEKEEAIKAYDGCEDEVYVLSMLGEPVGYYKSINQLCDKNGFENKSSVYRYWKKKQAAPVAMPMLFDAYTIDKLA